MIGGGAGRFVPRQSHQSCHWQGTSPVHLHPEECKYYLGMKGIKERGGGFPKDSHTWIDFNRVLL